MAVVGDDQPVSRRRVIASGSAAKLFRSGCRVNHSTPALMKFETAVDGVDVGAAV